MLESTNVHIGGNLLTVQWQGTVGYSTTQCNGMNEEERKVKSESSDSDWEDESKRKRNTMYSMIYRTISP